MNSIKNAVSLSSVSCTIMPFGLAHPNPILISTRQRGLTMIYIIQSKLSLMSYVAEIPLLPDFSLFLTL